MIMTYLDMVSILNAHISTSYPIHVIALDMGYFLEPVSGIRVTEDWSCTTLNNYTTCVSPQGDYFSVTTPQGETRFFKVVRIEDKLKELLLHVVLYQYGKYSEEKIRSELFQFLRYSEDLVCMYIRKNVNFCYRDYLEEYKNRPLLKKCVRIQRDYYNEIENTMSLMPQMAYFMELSIELYCITQRYVDTTTLIMIFDKIIHLEHLGGAMFNVNIKHIKEEVDREVSMYL